MAENREVIETIWWTTLHACVGVVITKDRVTKKVKAFISACEGKDQEADIYFIMNFGAKLLLTQVEAIRSYLEVEKE